MSKAVNIIKLCVGAEAVEDLQRWQDSHRGAWPEGRAYHVTRMWPKREAEVLAGSLYWVFKGQILARQKITGLHEIDQGDGVRRCAIELDAEIIRTNPAPRRPFQGWRYLDVADSPPDMAKARASDDQLPASLAAALAEIGLH